MIKKASLALSWIIFFQTFVFDTINNWANFLRNDWGNFKILKILLSQYFNDVMHKHSIQVMKSRCSFIFLFFTFKIFKFFVIEKLLYKIIWRLLIFYLNKNPAINFVSCCFTEHYFIFNLTQHLFLRIIIYFLLYANNCCF